jgi:PBSX family phage portal protein
MGESKYKIKIQRFEASKDTKNAVGSNLIEVDPFDSAYSAYNLIVPPFTPHRMNAIYKDSDILQKCISAYKTNIDGFGYHLLYLEEDRQRKSREAKRQKENLEGFFEEPNEDCSFQTVRQNMRRDYETFGYCMCEFTRFPLTGGIATCNYLPVIDIRLSKLDVESTTIQVPLFRDNELKMVSVRKRFRRFAQVQSADHFTLRWFKSFGDPRYVDAITGKYTSHRPKQPATEILYIRRQVGMDPYGHPRWEGSVPDVLGRAAAQFINYDLMDNQGIPPTIIVVKNGSLTDESKRELQKLVTSMRGAENFNRMALLEAIPELHGIDDKGNVSVDFQSMSEYRREDLMFGSYLDKTSDDVRQAFRLPSIYVGQESEQSYATGYAAQRICEQQVFVPAREAFDEVINRRVIRQEFKCDLWQYQSKGPRIASSEELRLAMKEFNAAGAMTVNHAIQIANEMFGLQMSVYSEEWADLPVSFVKTQLNNGTLVIPEITNNPILSDILGQRQPEEKPTGRPATSSEPAVPETPSGKPGAKDRKKGEMIDA